MIANLTITDFRNLAAIDLTPSPSLNIICGDNGSGKTSLLEAIHFIGMGKSFRTSTAGRLIRHQTDKFILFAQLHKDSERQIPVGIEKEANGSMRLRISEQEASGIAEIASFLPIRIINTHSHQIFEAGPLFRRKFLDWGLFYHSESFLSCWRHFERALKQRNATLRDKCPKPEVDSWTVEFIKHALEFHRLRLDYVEKLTPYLNETVHELLGIGPLNVTYLPGWDESLDFSAVLEGDFAQDFRFGHTQAGPHRADLEIGIEGILAKNFLSRGQQKLLVCAMIVAQGMLLQATTNKRVIYLIDDLPAELDKQGRDKLMSMLAKQQTQVFITAIEKETICDFVDADLKTPVKLFHVEHGQLR